MKTILFLQHFVNNFTGVTFKTNGGLNYLVSDRAF